VWCVYVCDFMCGFFSAWLWVFVGFVMCGCVFVWVLKCVGVLCIFLILILFLQ